MENLELATRIYNYLNNNGAKLGNASVLLIDTVLKDYRTPKIQLALDLLQDHIIYLTGQIEITRTLSINTNTKKYLIKEYETKIKNLEAVKLKLKTS